MGTRVDRDPGRIRNIVAKRSARSCAGRVFTHEDVHLLWEALSLYRKTGQPKGFARSYTDTENRVRAEGWPEVCGRNVALCWRAPFARRRKQAARTESMAQRVGQMEGKSTGETHDDDLAELGNCCAGDSYKDGTFSRTRSVCSEATNWSVRPYGPGAVREASERQRDFGSEAGKADVE